MWDDFGVDFEALVTCKRCGETNLNWVETDDGWRLFDEFGDRHVCEPDHSSLAKEFKRL